MACETFWGQIRLGLGGTTMVENLRYRPVNVFAPAVLEKRLLGQAIRLRIKRPEPLVRVISRRYSPRHIAGTDPEYPFPRSLDFRPWQPWTCIRCVLLDRFRR